MTLQNLMAPLMSRSVPWRKTTQSMILLSFWKANRPFSISRLQMRRPKTNLRIFQESICWTNSSLQMRLKRPLQDLWRVAMSNLLLKTESLTQDPWRLKALRTASEPQEFRPSEPQSDPMAMAVVQRPTTFHHIRDSDPSNIQVIPDSQAQNSQKWKMEMIRESKFPNLNCEWLLKITLCKI